MFNTAFVDKLFEPQELYGLVPTRTLFMTLCHSSVMRLTEENFAKLYNLMLMTFKYQILHAVHPRQILMLTFNHLEAVQKVALATPELSELVGHVHTRLEEVFCAKPASDWQFIKETMLGFLQGQLSPISLLIKNDLQYDDGWIKLPSELPTSMHAVERIGLITYFESGSERTQFFPCSTSTKGMPEEGSTDRGQSHGTDLGENLFAKFSEGRANGAPSGNASGARAEDVPTHRPPTLSAKVILSDAPEPAAAAARGSSKRSKRGAAAAEPPKDASARDPRSHRESTGSSAKRSGSVGKRGSRVQDRDGRRSDRDRDRDRRDRNTERDRDRDRNGSRSQRSQDRSRRSGAQPRHESTSSRSSRSSSSSDINTNKGSGGGGSVGGSGSSSSCKAKPTRCRSSRSHDHDPAPDPSHDHDPDPARRSEMVDAEAHAAAADLLIDQSHTSSGRSVRSSSDGSKCSSSRRYSSSSRDRQQHQGSNSDLGAKERHSDKQRRSSKSSSRDNGSLRDVGRSGRPARSDRKSAKEVDTCSQKLHEEAGSSSTVAAAKSSKSKHKHEVFHRQEDVAATIPTTPTPAAVVLHVPVPAPRRLVARTPASNPAPIPAPRPSAVPAPRRLHAPGSTAPLSSSTTSASRRSRKLPAVPQQQKANESTAAFGEELLIMMDQIGV